MSDRIRSFEEFWPYYVLEHENQLNRKLHFVGTTAAMAVVGTALIKRNPALIPLALVAGYGPAWVGHFFVEKNKPASFKYPLWSLLGDFKMWGKTIRGTMNREVERQQAKRTKVTAEAREAAAKSVN